MFHFLIIHQIFLLARECSTYVTWSNMHQLKPAKTGKYASDIPQFSKPHVMQKNIWWIIKKTASIWRENMLGYVSLDITCS